MMIIGSALKELIDKSSICSEDCFDNTCITISLGKTVKKINSKANNGYIEYGQFIPNDWIETIDISKSGLVLPPHGSILAVSEEKIQMPNDIFGLLQTKGSLARLSVSIHFSDGQIDPGFGGHITFEIFNGSDMYIKIPCGKPVGNVYFFECKGVCLPYNGKFANSNTPTVY